MAERFAPVDLDRAVAECVARYLGTCPGSRAGDGTAPGQVTDELAEQLRSLVARNPQLARSIVEQLARSIDAALGGAFTGHLDQLYAVAVSALKLEDSTAIGFPLGGGYGSAPVKVSELEARARAVARSRASARSRRSTG
jgi:hypothetical protein